MKKIILISAIVLLNFLTFSSQAQNVSIGPILGLNFATLGGDGVSNNQLKTGFAGGLFVNYSISDDFGLSGQLLYSQQGTKIKNENNPFKVDYLQIPILATYYLGKTSGKFRPKVFLGPQFGILLSAKDTDGTNIKSSTESSDISGVLGLGFNYNLSKGIWLNIDLRGGWGFEDISKTAKVYNRYGALMAGVTFPLGNYKE